MDSEKAVALLASNGFNAYSDKGIVMIASSDKEDMGRIRSILQNAQYKGSFGWKMDYGRDGNNS